MICLYSYVWVVCKNTERREDFMFQNTIPTFTFQGRLKLKNTCPKLCQLAPSRINAFRTNVYTEFQHQTGENILFLSKSSRSDVGSTWLPISGNFGIFPLEYRAQTMRKTTQFLLVPG